MKLKVDFSLSKLLRLRIGLKLGRADGAAVDVRLRVRGREPLRWKAALGPSSASGARAPALEPAEAPTFDDDPLLPRN